MSLIVLSNKNFNDSSSNVPIGGITSPFSFVNTLQSPLVLPPNAQVALQSVKFNKDGLFSLNKSNSRMYQYIGVMLDDGDDVPGGEAAKSTRFPALMEVGPYGEYSAEGFVNIALKPAMEKALYHPNYQGLSNASVQRSASGLTFEGFNLTYDKTSKASTQTLPPNGATVKGTQVSDGWSYATNKFTKTSGNGSVNGRAFAQFTNAPLSLTEGELSVNFANASSWTVGLSRYCNPSFTYVDQSSGKTTTNIVDRTQPKYFKQSFGFYDYLANAELNASNEHELKLYHAVQSSTEENTLEMKEVLYYGYTGATYATPYNLTTNASGFNQIHFKAFGERMQVRLSKGGGSDTIVCDPTLGTPAKINYMKPVAQTCAYLYPKLEISENLADDGQGQYLTFVGYQGVTLTGFDYDGLDHTASPSRPLRERLINFDWWATMVNIGKVRYCLEVDTRVYNDMSDPTQHIFNTTSGGKIDYVVVPVVSQSYEFIPSDFANMQTLLGFDENALRNPTSLNGSAVTFTSDSAPVLQSNESIFIRINSLTQRSFNGVTANESKIIYHCPRFDIAGNQTGGLFFEPGEKTYLDIGNVGETQINSFSVDLVDSSERLVKSVVGSTVVVLHIKEKDTK